MNAADILAFNSDHKTFLHRDQSPADIEFEAGARGKLFTVEFGTVDVTGQPTQYGGIEMHRVGIMKFPISPEEIALSTAPGATSNGPLSFRPQLYQSFIVRAAGDVALLNTRWKITDTKSATTEPVLRYTCQRIEDGSP